MTEWLEGPSIDGDVVISSRIRIARNLEDYKYPNIISINESDELTNNILEGLKSDLDGNYNFFRTRDLSMNSRNKYVEKHVISPNIINNKDISSFLLRDDEKATIMINEEDHLRVQTLNPGLNLEDSWQLSSNIDDILDNKLEYAYDNNFGYLTACPTNVGTGLRASVMVHLPFISMTGGMKTLINNLKKVGIITRGIYGEGSKVFGSVYQISNQRTLGESEEEIIERLNRIVKDIITKERETREYLMKERKVDIEDKVYRSLGLLKYAKILSTEEAMLHLLNIRLGKEIEVLDYLNYKEIDNLMIDIQPANIQSYVGRDLDSRKRDIERANKVRSAIEKVEG